jgi:hypothetical protein
MAAFARDLADRITRTIQGTHGTNFEQTVAMLEKKGSGNTVSLKGGDNRLRLQLASKMVSMMSDLLLLHERDLKVIYKEMAQQIERIHGLQMNAKYVGLSGTKNIVFGLWLITYSFLIPRAQMQMGGKPSLLAEQTPISETLQKKLQQTCQQVLAASNYLQRDPNLASQPNYMENLIGYNEENIVTAIRKIIN